MYDLPWRKLLDLIERKLDIQLAMPKFKLCVWLKIA